MMEEEPIDDFLRRKLEEADLSYQEEYWLKAEALLNAEEKRRKRAFFFWWFSLFGVILLIAAGGWFWINQSSPNNGVGHENSLSALDTLTKGSRVAQNELENRESHIEISKANSSDKPLANLQSNIEKGSSQLFDQEENRGENNTSSSANSGMRSSFSKNRIRRGRTTGGNRGLKSSYLQRETAIESADTSLLNSSNFIEIQELAILKRLPAQLLTDEVVLGPEFSETTPIIKQDNKKSTDKESVRKSRTDIELFIHAPFSSAVGVGLRRTQYLGSITSLTYGVGALSQHQVGQSFRWDSTKYDFGFSRVENELKPIWILEGVAHLGILLQLHRSHTLSAGVNWHMPLYGLEELSQTQSSDFEQSRMVSSQQWGRPSGYNNSFSIQLGYEFAWSSKLSLGIYWIGQRRSWHTRANDPLQDFSQLKLSGRWRIW